MIAPSPQFPERAGTVYDRESAPSRPGGRGPLRFEEGVASDTDVPSDFTRGAREAAIPAPGRPNHVNPAVLFKHADETMRERAHVGSAAWVDARSLVSEFGDEAFGAPGEQTYELIRRPGSRQERIAPTVVRD